MRSPSSVPRTPDLISCSCSLRSVITIECSVPDCSARFLSITTGLLPHLLEEHFIPYCEKELQTLSMHHHQSEENLKMKNALEIQLQMIKCEIQKQKSVIGLVTYSQSSIRSIVFTNLLQEPCKIQLSTSVLHSGRLERGPSITLTSLRVKKVQRVSGHSHHHHSSGHGLEHSQ